MSLSEDILEGLTDFKQAIDENNVTEKLTVRKVKLNLTPTDFDPETVCVIRNSLQMSQAVFAQFIGVTVKTVQAWEQGANPVTGAAARLLDEVQKDPAYWRRRVSELFVENV